MKQKRSRLRKLAEQYKFDPVKVETLCLNLGLERLAALCDTQDLNAEKFKTVCEDELKRITEEKTQKEELAIKLAQEETLKKREAEEEKEDSSWSSEELALLTKAIVKFPGGTPARWQQIQTFIGGGKSPKQIVKKVNRLKTEELTTVAQTRELEDSFERYKREKKKLRCSIRTFSEL